MVVDDDNVEALMTSKIVDGRMENNDTAYALNHVTLQVPGGDVQNIGLYHGGNVVSLVLLLSANGQKAQLQMRNEAENEIVFAYKVISLVQRTYQDRPREQSTAMSDDEYAVPIPRTRNKKAPKKRKRVTKKKVAKKRKRVTRKKAAKKTKAKRTRKR